MSIAAILSRLLSIPYSDRVKYMYISFASQDWTDFDLQRMSNGCARKQIGTVFFPRHNVL